MKVNNVFPYAVLVVLVLFLRVHASVPPMINYQGKLGNASGAPVADDIYSMRFAIYDVSVGGSALWTETNPNVQVKGGLFSVLLGSVTNIPPSVFNASNRFFGVTVGTDPEMTPRQEIASVGFAANAAVADTATLADTASTVPDGAITMSKIANGAVSSVQIADSSINTNHIADQSVTTTKLADGAVTASKMESQQAWIQPTLLNGWVNFGQDDTPVEYMKDSLGFVHLRGTVRGGTLGSAICNLPVGFRTQFTYYAFPCCVWRAVDNITITSSGDVLSSSLAAAQTLLEFSVDYKAEQ
jgi:hypothetical protein